MARNPDTMTTGASTAEPTSSLPLSFEVNTCEFEDISELSPHHTSGGTNGRLNFRRLVIGGHVPQFWIHDCVLTKKPAPIRLSYMTNHSEAPALEHLQTFVTVGIPTKSFSSLQKHASCRFSKTTTADGYCWTDMEIPSFLLLTFTEGDLVHSVRDARDKVGKCRCDLSCSLQLEMHKLYPSDGSGEEDAGEGHLILRRAHVLGEASAKVPWECEEPKFPNIASRRLLSILR